MADEREQQDESTKREQDERALEDLEVEEGAETVVGGRAGPGGGGEDAPFDPDALG